VVRDAQAFVDFLDSLPEKAAGGVGTVGYCLGGRLSLITAGAVSGRIKVAASFHGWDIGKEEDPDSPHHRAHDIKATVYVAGAIEDQFFTDEQKDRLDEALTEAGVAHTIETYPAYHGFAVPDNNSYDEAAAERHWQVLENFFESAFAS